MAAVRVVDLRAIDASAPHGVLDRVAEQRRRLDVV
jgi:hypothetical protein